MAADDISTEQLLDQMESVLQNNPNAQLYVKWTCPNCGDRVTSTTPNVFNTGGYKHDECGHLYTGDRFGFLAVFPGGEQDGAAP